MMRKVQLISFILVVLLEAGCELVNSEATVPEVLEPGYRYYVSIYGNDDYTGTMDEPFRTIQRAADLVEPGDTVFIGAGQYAGFMVERGGTAALPVLFQAQVNGVVVNSRNHKTQDNINIESWDYPDPPDYVILDGFTVSNAPRDGIRVIGGRGVVIRNNTVSNCAMFGIFSAYAPEIQVINNFVSGTHVGSSPSEGHGIYLSNSDTPDDNLVVRGNTVSGNGGNGIQLNSSVEDGDSLFTGCLVECNRVSGNYYKGFSLIGVSDSIIRNNVVFHNGTSGDGAGGIHLVHQPGMTNYSCRNIVVNNTVIEPVLAAVRINDGSRDNILFNNICISGNPIALEGDGNLVDVDSNIQRAGTAGLFVDAGTHDYHLAPAGDAVDNGVSLYEGAAAPPVDWEGTSRPQEAGIDSGAYESVQ